jgi:glycosyltransferase involved in cell wall biosynthesis
MPEVDVIIPFHRNDGLLREAIASARASIEVLPHLILVNDTGEEIARDVLGLAESDSLVMNFKKGYVGALRTGIEASTSQYIAFLDSDDLTDSQRLIKQINRIRQEGVDYVSGNLQKFGKTTKRLNPRSPFGRLPKVSDPRLLLFIGAHSADSTIVAKGSSLRESWKMHSKFGSSVADYGWLLCALSLGHTLSHQEDAIYYYRSHSNQLSRANSLSAEWPQVWPMWDAFRKEKAMKLHNFASANIDSQVALALAFPATLPSLNSQEVHSLEKAIHAFLDDLKILDKDSLSDWRRTMWRRYLLAARFRGTSKFNYLFGLIFDVLIQFLYGVNIRAKNQTQLTLLG